MTDSIPGRLFCTHKSLVPLRETKNKIYNYPPPGFEPMLSSHRHPKTVGVKRFTATLFRNTEV